MATIGEQITQIRDYLNQQPNVSGRALDVRNAFLNWYALTAPTAAMNIQPSLNVANNMKAEFLKSYTPPPPALPTFEVVTNPTTGKKEARLVPPIDPNKGFPTLRRFVSNNPVYVKQWQAIVGVTPDGVFGPGLEASTKAWQTAHGLQATGVVDAATWAKATGSTVVPQTGAQTVAAAPKPRTPPGPKQTFADAVAAIPPTPPSLQANIMGKLSGLPSWAKWVLGISTAGAVGYGVMYQPPQSAKK
jgi:peptidoglycan hydrolase-like protein with peptidoglycan-binding domain